MSADTERSGVRYAGDCADCDRTVTKHLPARTEFVNDSSGERVRCGSCGEIVYCDKHP